MFDAHFNGVAVESGVEWGAVTHAIGVEPLALRKVALAGGLHGVVLELGLFHHGLEVDVPRFVVGRIGVGDVLRQHFQASAFDLQSLFMHTECLV